MPNVTIPDPWYNIHQTCVEFGQWLIDNAYLDTPIDVLCFFEKPWHWEPEYETYRQHVDAEVSRVHAHG